VSDAGALFAVRSVESVRRVAARSGGEEERRRERRALVHLLSLCLFTQQLHASSRTVCY